MHLKQEIGVVVSDPHHPRGQRLRRRVRQQVQTENAPIDLMLCGEKRSDDRGRAAEERRDWADSPRPEHPTDDGYEEDVTLFAHGDGQTHGNPRQKRLPASDGERKLLTSRRVSRTRIAQENQYRQRREERRRGVLPEIEAVESNRRRKRDQERC